MQTKVCAGIAMRFGGQTPSQERPAMVKASFGGLAEANSQGPVFLHLAVFLSTPNPHADVGKAPTHQVAFKDGTQSSAQGVHESPLNDTRLMQLRRSLLKRA